MKKVSFIIVFVLTICFVSQQNVYAQIPQTISYQGVIADGTGTVLPDGNYSLTFKLYLTPTGGSSLWIESQTVIVSKGIFNIILGNVNPLNLPFDKLYWLGITVGTGTELSPRIQMTSSAYSLNSRSLSDSLITGKKIARGQVVRSLNTLTDSVTLAAGANVTIVSLGNTITISSTSGTGGGSFKLPYAGAIADPGIAFSVVNNGNGASGLFQTSGKDPAIAGIGKGNGSAVNGLNSGTGEAGTFTIDNNLNTSHAVNAFTRGDGSAINALNSGKGWAGYFNTDNPNNTSATIFSTTNSKGDALNSYSIGDGSAGKFEIKNANNNSIAMNIITNGKGDALSSNTTGDGAAGKFEINNANNSSAVMNVSTNGTGRAGEFRINNSGGGEALFATTNSGSNSNAAHFEINNAANGGAGLFVTTNGTGNAGFFRSDNKDDQTSPALEAHSISKGAAIRGYNGGTGSAGLFENYAGGDSPTLWVKSNGEPGNGIKSEKNGDQGSAGYFINTKETNPTDALFGMTKGSGYAVSGNAGKNGKAARFIIDEASNNNTVMSANTNGAGKVADFEINNATTTSPVVYAFTNGMGRGGHFEIDNPNNQSDAVAGIARNDHHAVFGLQTGAGEAAHFEIANASNATRSVYIANNGTGDLFFGTNTGSGRIGDLMCKSTQNGLGIYNSAGSAAIMSGSGTSPILSVLGGTYAANFGGKIQVSGNGDFLGSLTAGSSTFNGSVSVNGNLAVSGILSKGGGLFKIDHPLDPENKFLSHSFVESPDMKNIYDGVITLNASGEALIELPDWFEALNRDFRYLLTPIGAPAPNLYIAKKIEHNKFKIAGGIPGLEVSWQVTGIRKDAFANTHRIPVEENKSDNERGLYLHPDAFGQPKEKGIGWAAEHKRLQENNQENTINQDNKFSDRNGTAK